MITLIKAIFLGTVLIATSSFANIFDVHHGQPLKLQNLFLFNDVPQLYPVGLFRANGKRSVYVMLARAKDGNTYVVVRDRYGVRVPKITSRSMTYYDGGLFSGGRGTHDLYFEMGGRFLVPSTQKQNYLNASQGVTLYSENYAPVSFTEVHDLRPSRLKALGFSSLLAPRNKSAKVKPQPKPAPLTTQEGAKLVMLQVVNPNEDFRSQYSSRRAIRDFGEKIDSSKAAVLETNLSGSGLPGGPASVFLVKQEALDDMKAAIAKLNVGDVREVNFTSIQKTLADGPAALKLETSEALRILEASESSSKINLEALASAVVVLANQNVKFWTQVKQERTKDEVIQLLRQIASVLGVLEKIHLALDQQMQYDVRVQFADRLLHAEVAASARANPLQSEMSKPLEVMGEKLLTVLDHFQHPEAQKIIFIAGTIMNGIGQRIYWQKASGSKKTYSQLYFENFRSSEKLGLEFLRKAEDLNKAGGLIRLESSGGGVFQNVFGSINGELVGIKDYTKGRALYSDRWTMNPLVDLGRPDRRVQVIQEVLQTVITLDKDAEFLAQWKRTKDKLYQLQRFGLDRAAGLEYIAQGYLSKPTIERITPELENMLGRPLRADFSVNQFIRENMIQDDRDGRDEKIYGSNKMLSLLMSIGWGWWTSDSSYPGFSQITFHKSAVEIFTKLMEASSISIINEGTYISVLEGAINLSRYLHANDDLVDPELAEGLRRMNAVIQNQLLRGFDPKKAVGNSTNGKAAPKYEFTTVRPAAYYCAHLFSTN